MKTQLPNFQQSKLLVIGDLMLDRYWYGGTSRISPEAPVPVVNVNNEEDRAGGAGNVALNIAALGGSATLLGICGDDNEADSLEQLLSERGVRCEFLRSKQLKTITKLRIMSRNQQLIRVDVEEPIGAEHAMDVASMQSLIEEHDVLVLSDYGKGTLQQPQELIKLARSLGKQVVVDPKGHDFSKYRGASVITPNQSEFDAIQGASVDDSTFFEKAYQLRDQLNLEHLLVTRSEKGMALFNTNETPFLQPTVAREVFDVTGAGDTVVASLALMLAAGASASDAVQMSNLAAGVVVGKLGTATVSRQELQAAMLSQQPLKQGVVSESELVDLIRKAQDSGESVVMTNGCFDILHSGHVSYLRQAAQCGDRLIIAVNSNDSVSRLKGPTRPINDTEQRMAVLAGLTSVDWVVEFTEDTPARLIGKCLPDVLVKGGDYKAEEVAGFEEVTANGGSVKILGFVDGVSTSHIIEKAQR